MRQAFANHDLPAQQIRRQVLLYLDNTLFCHDRDPYRLLGLAPNCSLDDIRLRHKQMLQVFHPDRHPDEEAWFTDRSEQLNRAYAYLKANHGRPGAASIPYASTVAGSPPPTAAAAKPRPRRRPPPAPVFPNKNQLRRSLNRWLGNSRSLQRRVYAVLFAIPALALLLLYLSSDDRVQPTSSTSVADAASEAGRSDGERNPPARQESPYHPAMGSDAQASSIRSEPEPPESVVDSVASNQPPATDVAMIEVDHPDDVRVSTLIHRVNSPFPDAGGATTSTSAVPRSSLIEEHREATNKEREQVTVASGAGAENIHPADADARSGKPTIVAAPRIPHPEISKPAATAAPGTDIVETDTEAATAGQDDGETEDQHTPSQQEPEQWTSQPLESTLEPLDPLPERPDPATVAPETPEPAKEPERPATPDPDKAERVAASDPAEPSREADPGAATDAGEADQTGTEAASTTARSDELRTPGSGPRTTSDQSRSPIAAIKALLADYQSAYNQSDLDRFSSLFGKHAQTRNAADRSEIREKYGELFRKTSERKLVLDDIRIRTLGERQYEVKTSYKVDWKYPGGKTSSSAGRFNIHVVTIDGELKIRRLDY